MNLEKYKNDGWGISRKCFKEIKEILDSFDSPVIVEFGSGISTMFLIDYLNLTKKTGKIISFENDKNFFDRNNFNDEKLDIRLKSLLECKDEDFNFLFLNHEYKRSLMKIKTSKLHTRQRNNFYDISKNELPNKIDLAIIDGPNGNGRSIAFLHLKDKIVPGSFIVIDDYTHYDFSERFLNVFPNSELVSETTSGKYNQWELGGDYRIYRIK